MNIPALRNVFLAMILIPMSEAATFSAVSIPLFASPAAAAQYQENPRTRKSRGRQAIIKAMELYARVELMLVQGSDDVALMYGMLDKSYGFQQGAGGELAGLNHEAKFKDPTMERLQHEINAFAKPGSLKAKVQIHNHDVEGAIETIRKVQLIHRRVLIAFT